MNTAVWAILSGCSTPLFCLLGLQRVLEIFPICILITCPNYCTSSIVVEGVHINTSSEVGKGCLSSCL